MESEFWSRLEDRFADFVTSHGLSFCHTLYFVEQELRAVNFLKPVEIKKGLTEEQIKIASLTITGKLVFNADIYENLDIAHFLRKLYTTEHIH